MMIAFLLMDRAQGSIDDPKPAAHRSRFGLAQQRECPNLNLRDTRYPTGQVGATEGTKLDICLKNRQSSSMSIDRWNVRRFREPNLDPVDLWDTCIDGEGPVSRSVFERLGRVRLEALRRDGVEDDEIASTLAGELVNVLEFLRRESAKTNSTSKGFDRVFVEGRILELTGFRAALTSHAPSFDIALAPPRPACIELGAERLMSRIQEPHAGHVLVVDVGHAAVRTVVFGRPPRRRSLERSFERLPLARGSVPPLTDGAAYVARSVELIARATVTSLTESTTLDPVLILSFPCDLDAEGTPGPCTYPGWEGNQTLVARIIEGIEEQINHCAPDLQPWQGRPCIDVWLLSHAELVALASEAVLGPARTDGTLSVCLGFGPGAAILRGTS